MSRGRATLMTVTFSASTLGLHTSATGHLAAPGSGGILGASTASLSGALLWGLAGSSGTLRQTSCSHRHSEVRQPAFFCARGVLRRHSTASRTWCSCTYSTCAAGTGSAASPPSTQGAPRPAAGRGTATTSSPSAVGSWASGGGPRRATTTARRRSPRRRTATHEALYRLPVADHVAAQATPVLGLPAGYCWILLSVHDDMCT
mmetsp:Transcript_121883/g.356226  ORF Transcript_121883/g.356226 Transcript_121883/m.356226 type:complete len:203 (-) Transcript_121883:15-623(-)